MSRMDAVTFPHFGQGNSAYIPGSFRAFPLFIIRFISSLFILNTWVQDVHFKAKSCSMPLRDILAERELRWMMKPAKASASTAPIKIMLFFISFLLIVLQARRRTRTLLQNGREVEAKRMGRS